MEHKFNVDVAKKYGISTALVLEHFRFWTLNNLANKRNLKEGLCWSYNTLEAFTIIFPYWTKRQIEHLLNKMVQQKLILKSNFNNKKYDRTCWYALAPSTYKFFPELCDENFYRLLFSSTSLYKNASQDPSYIISQICEMDFTKWGNAFPEFVTPIPVALTAVALTAVDTKSFCGTQTSEVRTNNVKSFHKKSVKDENQKAENEKKHEFAGNMNQMACEERHVQESAEFKKWEKATPMPEELRQIYKSLHKKIRRLQ